MGAGCSCGCRRGVLRRSRCCTRVQQAPPEAAVDQLLQRLAVAQEAGAAGRPGRACSVALGSSRQSRRRRRPAWPRTDQSRMRSGGARRAPKCSTWPSGFAGRAGRAANGPAGSARGGRRWGWWRQGLRQWPMEAGALGAHVELRLTNWEGGLRFTEEGHALEPQLQRLPVDARHDAERHQRAQRRPRVRSRW